MLLDYRLHLEQQAWHCVRYGRHAAWPKRFDAWSMGRGDPSAGDLRQIPADPGGVFIEMPTASPRQRRVALERLVRKFDPVERDFRNRQLGRAGEEFVVDLERRRLSDESRPDLARKVRWVAMEDGDAAGFDVMSFDAAGGERLIEVKTTNGAAETPFFMTRNEMAVATERSEHWHLYRVHLFAQQPGYSSRGRLSIGP